MPTFKNRIVDHIRIRAGELEKQESPDYAFHAPAALSFPTTIPTKKPGSRFWDRRSACGLW